VPHAVVAPLIAFLVSAGAVAWLARGKGNDFAVDVPNERSLHTRPVPRSGGFGILIGIATGWMTIQPTLPWSWWLAFGLIIAVSVADDLRGLHVIVRFATHLLAAALAASALLAPAEGWWLYLLYVLAIGWMCNLYNFMDGSDGLAGGMGSIGFAAYAAASWLAGNASFAALNLVIALACSSFLLFNFHPAKIFMGDTGSVSLGYLAATFGLTGWQQEIWGWWFPILVFSPFIADASVTLGRRLLSGVRIWEAHRDHYYQRLVRLGLGHRHTAFLEYALMFASSLCALGGLFLETSQRHFMLATVALIYAGFMAGIEIAWRSRGIRDV